MNRAGDPFAFAAASGVSDIVEDAFTRLDLTREGAPALLGYMTHVLTPPAMPEDFKGWQVAATSTAHEMVNLIAMARSHSHPYFTPADTLPEYFLCACAMLALGDCDLSRVNGLMRDPSLAMTLVDAQGLHMNVRRLGLDDGMSTLGLSVALTPLAQFFLETKACHLVTRALKATRPDNPESADFSKLAADVTPYRAMLAYKDSAMAGRFQTLNRQLEGCLAPLRTGAPMGEVVKLSRFRKGRAPG
jgi:hypothetical protein